jgi:hypothetical protein
MAKKSPRIYVYKITFKEVPHYYIGVHKEKRFDENYTGTPVTHKNYWEKYTPKKEIIKEFPYTNGGWSDAQDFEKELIRPVYNHDIYCLNENCGGKISLDKCIEAGKLVKEKKIGVFGLSTEELARAGSKGGKKAKEMGVGVHAIPPERRSEISRRVGKLAVENGTGIHGLSPERRTEISKKSGTISGRKHKENGTGIFGISEEERFKNCQKGGIAAGEKNKQNRTGVCGISPEDRSRNGRMGVEKQKELGVGALFRTPEKMSADGRKGGQIAYEKRSGFHKLTYEEKSAAGKKGGAIGGKKTASQRWQCTVTGYVSTAAGLSNYQRARGIETSKRIQIQ